MTAASDDDLVGTNDVARMAGVTSPVVSRWKQRHADFPKPKFTVSGRDVYLREDIRQWLVAYSEQRLAAAHAGLEAARAAVPKAVTTLSQAKAFYDRMHQEN